MDAQNTQQENFSPVLIMGGIATGKSFITKQLTEKIYERSNAKIATENFVEAPRENPYFSTFLGNPNDQDNTAKMQRYFLYDFSKKYEEASRRTRSFARTAYLSDTYPPISGSFYATAQVWMRYMKPEEYLTLIHQYNQHRYMMIPKFVILVRATDIYTNMQMLYERGVSSKDEFEFYLKNSAYFEFVRASNSLQFEALKNEEEFKNTKFIEFPRVYDDEQSIDSIADTIIKTLLL